MKTRSHACFVFAMLFIFSTMACAASEVSLAEDEDSGELYINMPVTGEATLTLTKDQLDENVTKFNVYDDGGKLGDYSKNANAILNIVVPEGYKMEVSGRALTEYFPKRTGLNDVLYIYDGSKELYQGGGKTGYDEDDGWWVGFASIDAVKSSGNKLTIKFQSNETEEFYGFTLNVRVFGPKHKYDVRLASSSDRIVDYDWTPYRVGSNGGEFMCRPCPALAGEEVTVFFESFYKDGYVLSALESVNLNERNGETVMAENNQLTFIMPADDVLLYPSLETLRSISVSENSGATVKVEKNGWAFVGTYAYKKWSEDDPELSGCNGSCVFGYAAEKIGKFNIGQFVKVGAGASIAPMRAYLLKLGKAKKVASPSFVARSSVASVEKTLPDHIDIVIDEGRGETLFVGRVNTHTGEFSKNRYNYIFDLKGRRIGNEVDKARGYYVKKLPRNY